MAGIELKRPVLFLERRQANKLGADSMEIVI